MNIYADLSNTIDLDFSGNVACDTLSVGTSATFTGAVVAGLSADESTVTVGDPLNNVFAVKALGITDPYLNSATLNSLNQMNTKGDLLTFSTVPARLGVGTDGQGLIADSATATGLNWGSPLVDANDLIGTTLASNVVNSSLTSLGTITNLNAGTVNTNTINGRLANTDITITPLDNKAINLVGATKISNGILYSDNLVNLSPGNDLVLYAQDVGNKIQLLSNLWQYPGLSITASSFIGDLTGNSSTSSSTPASGITGTTLASNVVNSSLTSLGTLSTSTQPNLTAGKATVLATPRTINTVSFDGSANITVPLQISNIITVGASGCDYTTITSAMNAITTNSSTNQFTILIGPGSYVEEITVKSYVYLVGMHRSNVRLSMTSITSGDSVINMSNGNSGIYNLTINVSTSTADTFYGVLMSSASNVVVDCDINMTCSNTGSNQLATGVMITGNNNRVQGCNITVSGAYYNSEIVGVRISTGFSGCTINNNVINVSKTGSAIAPSNYTYGIRIISTSTTNIISNNTINLSGSVFHSTDLSICISTGSGGVFSGNMCNLPVQSGYYAFNSFASPCNQNSIATYTSALAMGAGLTTITANTPASARTYTIIDTLANSQFIMSDGTQTIGGAKAISNCTALTVSGPANIAVNVNQTVNIGTGTNGNTVSIGGGSNAFVIGSNTYMASGKSFQVDYGWFQDISSARHQRIYSGIWNTAQSIAHTTVTKLTWNTGVFVQQIVDAGYSLSGNNLIIPSAGRYLINCKIAWQLANGYVTHNAYLNATASGSLFISANQPSTAGWTTTNIINWVGNLSASDQIYVEVYFTNGAGVNQNVHNTGAGTWSSQFSIVRLA